ncbi:MAG: ATP-binding cassette domain-containing protein [Acidobacteria bacterium]|nr:ATP-binding cassette domain-containing protein [Acidobacteriota bacterium]
MEIPLGQHVALLGPNGCGKSTIIKSIHRELYPDPRVAGSYISVFGERIWNIFELRSLVGIVSQDWMNMCTCAFPAQEIVISGFHGSVGIWPYHPVTPAMEEKARDVMALLEVDHLADRPTNELSTGEARRVLIARALVHGPKALILDEPTNSLDLRAMRHLREILRKIAASGVSIILVTHHLQDIIPEIERVILLKSGRVFADGEKAGVLTAANLGGLFDEPVALDVKDGYYHAW